MFCSFFFVNYILCAPLFTMFIEWIHIGIILLALLSYNFFSTEDGANTDC